jgi:hypothetical protein
MTMKAGFARSSKIRLIYRRFRLFGRCLLARTEPEGEETEKKRKRCTKT